MALGKVMENANRVGSLVTGQYEFTRRCLRREVGRPCSEWRCRSGRCGPHRSSLLWASSHLDRRRLKIAEE